MTKDRRDFDRGKEDTELTETPLFVGAGNVLFGARWQADLAAALDVNERTIRRWAADEGLIPDGAWDDLVELLNEQSVLSRKLADEIKGKMGL